VKDVVAANVFMAQSKWTGVYNVAYGKRLTINELANMIISILGSKSKIRHLPERPGDIKHSMASIDKLLGTGFSPKSNFKEGLEKTIQYFSLI